MVLQQKCLVLSPHPDPIVRTVEASGDLAEVSDAITGHPDWVISYGHRHIIREPELTVFKDRIINLHISYLPWGRGADPNLWAWVDGEPHGVTLHYVDSGIDTGDIIDQCLAPMDGAETLATSYKKLHEAAVALFDAAWPRLRNGSAERRAQPPGGSFHRQVDKDALHLPQGWETPVDAIQWAEGATTADTSG